MHRANADVRDLRGARQTQGVRQHFRHVFGLQQQLRFVVAAVLGKRFSMRGVAMRPGNMLSTRMPSAVEFIAQAVGNQEFSLKVRHKQFQVVPSGFTLRRNIGVSFPFLLAVPGILREFVSLRPLVAVAQPFQRVARCLCYDARMRYGSQALRFSVVLLLSAEAVAGQQQPKPKDLPEAPVPKQEQVFHKHDNAFRTTVEVLGRRSIFFPDLATSPGPLDTKQKLELFAGKSIAPSRWLASGIGAGVGQARDSLPDYGQGVSGYGKRFGSSMASGVSSEFFTFLFASGLHRDPRYFVSLRGGPWRRIRYGVSRLVVTRTDAGTEGANWPGMLAPLFAESLANSYLPVKEQTAGRTFRRYGVRLGFTAVANVSKEYWPTIFRNLRIAKIAPSLNANSSTAPSRPPGAQHFLP